jgi:hypothetical protein
VAVRAVLLPLMALLIIAKDSPPGTVTIREQQLPASVYDNALAAATKPPAQDDGAFIANNNARQIVCEEWHKAVKEFSLKPRSHTETVVSRIIDRLDSVRSRYPALSTTSPGEA